MTKRKARDECNALRYRSTSRKAPLTSLRGAVLRGLAPDGGLYLPVEIARHSSQELEEFRSLPFTEVCFRVARPFAAPDVREEVLWQIVRDRKSTRLNSSHQIISYPVFSLKK